MTDLRQRALEIAKAPHCFANEVVAAVIHELLGELADGSFYKESDIDRMQARIAELEARK